MSSDDSTAENAADIDELISYARSSDLGSDPLVIDLIDAIGSLRDQLAEVNEQKATLNHNWLTKWGTVCAERDEAQANSAAMTDATDVRYGSKSERLLKIAMLGSAPSSTGGNESQGAALIAAERKRQVTEEGYDAEHDKGHAGELTRAASAYALAGADDLDALGYVANNPVDPPADWPWRERDWKPTGDAIPDLVKAGGLIAAALDSLIAEGGNDHE